VNEVRKRSNLTCSKRCHGARLRERAQANRPICSQCKEKPVSRYCGKFCSKACAATRPQGQWNTRAATEARIRMTHRRIVAVIAEDVRAQVDADGRLPIAAAIRLAVKYRRIGYARGYGASHQRALRARRTA
jgi:hypothetical protein